MAKTASRMINLSTPAPDFALPDTVSGKIVKLHDGNSYKGTVITFICNHCPFVKHIAKPLADIAKRYAKQGIRFIAISANDAEHYPQDGPAKMKENAIENDYTFPYLYDETQAVAKAYQATCTPDIFVFNNALNCVYRGQFDASTPGNNLPATGDKLAAALEALISGIGINPDQQPSIGCNIKWKT